MAPHFRWGTSFRNPSELFDHNVERRGPYRGRATHDQRYAEILRAVSGGFTEPRAGRESTSTDSHTDSLSRSSGVGQAARFQYAQQEHRALQRYSNASENQAPEPIEEALAYYGAHLPVPPTSTDRIYTSHDTYPANATTQFQRKSDTYPHVQHINERVGAPTCAIPGASTLSYVKEPSPGRADQNTPLVLLPPSSICINHKLQSKPETTLPTHAKPSTPATSARKVTFATHISTPTSAELYLDPCESDISENSDAGLDADEICASHKFAQIIFILMLYSNLCLFNAKHAASNYADGQSAESSGTSQQAFTPTTTSGQGSKRKRQGSGSSQPGGDSEGHGSNGGGGGCPPDGSRNKKSRTSRKPVRYFACPYAKADPIRHELCLCRRLSNVSAVKQHIKRVHKMPNFYCARCWLSFTGDRERDAHIRGSPCTEAPDPHPELLREEDFQVIAQKRRNEDEFTWWYSIFFRLFPDSRGPDSPYHDLSARHSAAVHEFDSFLPRGRRLYEELRTVDSRANLPPLRPEIENESEAIYSARCDQFQGGHMALSPHNQQYPNLSAVDDQGGHASLAEDLQVGTHRTLHELSYLWSNMNLLPVGNHDNNMPATEHRDLSHAQIQFIVERTVQQILNCFLGAGNVEARSNQLEGDGLFPTTMIHGLPELRNAIAPLPNGIHDDNLQNPDHEHTQQMGDQAAQYVQSESHEAENIEFRDEAARADWSLEFLNETSSEMEDSFKRFAD